MRNLHEFISNESNRFKLDLLEYRDSSSYKDSHIDLEPGDVIIWTDDDGNKFKGTLRECFQCTYTLEIIDTKKLE